MRKGEIISTEIKELRLVEVTEIVAINEVGASMERTKYSLVDLDNNIVLDNLDLRELR